MERSWDVQWRRLHDQHNADVGLWRERLDALLARMDSAFASEGASQAGRAENAVRAADEYERACARETAYLADVSRATMLQALLWDTEAAFVRHREAFLARLRAAERGIETEAYSAPTLGPVRPSLSTGYWFPPGSSRIRVGAKTTAYPPQRDLVPLPFSPPFSLANILKAPGVAHALPTASSRVQMRAAFREAQARREQRFDAAMAAFEAEFQGAQRRHAAALGLHRWRARVAEAERERAAVFARWMEAAQAEWEEYRVLRAQEDDTLVWELSEHFLRSQLAREEAFKACVRQMHDQFVQVVWDASFFE